MSKLNRKERKLLKLLTKHNQLSKEFIEKSIGKNYSDVIDSLCNQELVYRKHAEGQDYFYETDTLCLFPTIPEGDYVISDKGKEILNRRVITSKGLSEAFKAVLGVIQEILKILKAFL